MFTGEYHHNIDDKGRLVIPTKYRLELKDKFIICRGIEKCLYVYTMEDWVILVAKMQTLSFTKKDARIFTRTFFSGANEIEVDKQGRATILQPLIKHAEITKECVVIGANDRIEIWSETLWNEFLIESEDILSDVAENLFMDVNV